MDLAIWAPLAACLICLSAAWMAGYIGGIRRYAVLTAMQSTKVVVSTHHPRYLETLGAMLFVSGVAIAWGLIVIGRRRRSNELSAAESGFSLPWFLQLWKVVALVAICLVLNQVLINYGAKHGLKLSVSASGTTMTKLALDPAIRISVRCSLSPCRIPRAAAQHGMTDLETVADSRSTLDRQRPLFDIDTHHAERKDTDDIDDFLGPTVAVRSREIDAVSALADLDLKATLKTRARRYVIPKSAFHAPEGLLRDPDEVLLLLADRDLHTVEADVRRRRIFRDGTVFVPLQLWIETGARRDSTTLRVYVPVKSA